MRQSCVGNFLTPPYTFSVRFVDIIHTPLSFAFSRLCEFTGSLAHLIPLLRIFGFLICRLNDNFAAFRVEFASNASQPLFIILCLVLRIEADFACFIHIGVQDEGRLTKECFIDWLMSFLYCRTSARTVAYHAFKHHTYSAQNNFYIWKISHYDVAKRVLVAILAASCSMSLSWSRTSIMTCRNPLSL